MIAHAIAAALIVSQAAAPPPARPCVSKEEAGAIAAVALPEFVQELGQRCSQHLPPAAYLKSGAPALVQRWRSEAAPHRDAAFAGMRRMAGGQAAMMQPEVGLSALIGAFAGGMSSKLTPASCGELSRFVESVAPLPAQNVAQMVSAMIGFGMAMEPPRGQGGPPICRT